MFADEFVILRIPKRSIPAGARFVEAYETECEIIVLGDPPESEDEETGHNCDQMGCGSLSHVLYRFDKHTATVADVTALRDRCAALEAALAYGGKRLIEVVRGHGEGCKNHDDQMFWHYLANKLAAAEKI